MRKILTLTLLLSLLLPGSVLARGVGTSGANFLKIGQGARPAGMGSAFVALADDLNSLEWNPAGLASLQPDFFDASFEHVFWFGDVESEILTYGQNLGENRGGAVQLFYRHLPDIDNNLEDDLPQKVFDFVGTVGYGFQMTNFSVGANLKFIMSRLGPADLFGEAVDLGMLIHLMNNKISIGLAIQNLGPDMQSDSLPLNIRGGVAYKNLLGAGKHELNAAAEINQPLDNKLNLNLGLEYWYMELFAARIGYRQQLGGNDLQSDSLMQRLTAGATVRWADLQVDYAFVPYADLGGTHRLGLTLHYGPMTDFIEKQ